MLDADKLRGVAPVITADLGAAMSASIHPPVIPAVTGMGDDDRCFADEGRLVVASIRELGREREETPVRPSEYPPLFLFVDVFIGEDPVWSARAVGD
jgi:hypothetical protein